MADRKSGPQGVARPYEPQRGVTDPNNRIAEALDHIAVVLSSMDNNLEQLAGHVAALANAQRPQS